VRERVRERERERCSYAHELRVCEIILPIVIASWFCEEKVSLFSVTRGIRDVAKRTVKRGRSDKTLLNITEGPCEELSYAAKSVINITEEQRSRGYSAESLLNITEEQR
jgi:hypothetical protein